MTLEKSQFLDREGQAWTITLDPILLAKVKEHCGIGLTDLKADPFFRLASDSLMLIEVTWLLCEEEATEKGLKYLEFVKRITGEQLDGMIAALEVAVVNFCPSSMRSALKSLIEENSTTRQETTERTVKEIRENRREFVDKMVKRAMTHLRKSLDSTDSPLSEDGKSAT